jgi:hypothetical protein
MGLPLFSPVVRYSTLTVLFAITNEINLDMDHLDIDATILNRKLSETIYMEQPIGYEVEGDKVCLLQKNIYGLKQARRAWNKRIYGVLKELGFTQSKTQPCIYIKIKGNI